MSYTRQHFEQIQELVPDIMEILRQPKNPPLGEYPCGRQEYRDRNRYWPFKKRGIQLHLTVSVLLDMEDPEMCVVYHNTGGPPTGGWHYLHGYGFKYR